MRGDSLTPVRAFQPHDAGLLIDTEVERCGFVVKHPVSEVPQDALRYSFLEVRNISKTPRQNFEMDQETMIRLLNEYNVIGVWHSHPTGSREPSEMDREWHPRQFDMYIIAGLRINRYVPVGARDFRRTLVPWRAADAGDGEGN